MAIPDNVLIPLRAANLSPDAVTLHRGTTIGKFYSLSQWNEITTEGAEYYEIPPESNNHSVNQVRVELSAAELLGIDMEEHHKRLEDLVQEFLDVFSTGKQDLGWTDWVYAKSQRPIFFFAPSQLGMPHGEWEGSITPCHCISSSIWPTSCL